MPKYASSKVPIPLGDPGPHLIHGSLGPPESTIQRHLNRFIRFGTTHARVQPTDHATAVTVGRILCYSRRCGLIMYNIYYVHGARTLRVQVIKGNFLASAGRSSAMHIWYR